jgi:hypothetical protein
VRRGWARSVQSMSKAAMQCARERVQFVFDVTLALVVDLQCNFKRRALTINLSLFASHLYSHEHIVVLNDLRRHLTLLL